MLERKLWECLIIPSHRFALVGCTQGKRSNKKVLSRYLFFECVKSPHRANNTQHSKGQLVLKMLIFNYTTIFQFLFSPQFRACALMEVIEMIASRKKRERNKSEMRSESDKKLSGESLIARMGMWKSTREVLACGKSWRWEKKTLRPEIFFNFNDFPIVVDLAGEEPMTVTWNSHDKS